MGDVVPFRKNCRWNDGGACLARSPFACICSRPSVIKAARQLSKPGPHSPYHTSLLMQPGRDAGSIGWTPELRALEHAEMVEAISAAPKTTGDVIKELPPERIARIKARADELIRETNRRDLLAFAKTGSPSIVIQISERRGGDTPSSEG
jgi:hypothetical protein